MVEAVHERSENPSLQARRMHSHENYEIFLLLSGDVDYRVEGSLYHLKPGDLMLMRKGEVHISQIRSSAAYERMHVNFDLDDALAALSMPSLLSVFHDRPLGQFNHYSASLFPDNRWEEYLNRICLAESQGEKLCYLLPLLADLGKQFCRVRCGSGQEDRDRAQEMVRFINAHLSEELSLDFLSERFFLSKTHLNRIFKQSTGTTAWEYITIKRLFLAKEWIQNGHRPTKICQRCGFKDYTTFFRAYKKYFGTAPGRK